MDFKATLLMSQFVTHDVKRFVFEKPHGFSFTAGQGVEVVIDQPDWREEEGTPFTPTSLAGDRVLEFTIKRYAEHKGVTDRLHSLEPGATILLAEPFGTIGYEGPGTFIAGGAGITPFLSIFRQLVHEGTLRGSRLVFSNKTPADVICEKELRHYFGENCLLTCTRESGPGFGSRRIDKDYLLELVKDKRQKYYVCGPDEFVEEINAALQSLGVNPSLLIYER